MGLDFLAVVVFLVGPHVNTIFGSFSMVSCFRWCCIIPMNPGLRLNPGPRHREKETGKIKA